MKFIGRITELSITTITETTYATIILGIFCIKLRIKNFQVWLTKLQDAIMYTILEVFLALIFQSVYVLRCVMVNRRVKSRLAYFSSPIRSEFSTLSPSYFFKIKLKNYQISLVVFFQFFYGRLFRVILYRLYNSYQMNRKLFL